MRNLREVKHEIDMVEREMAQWVITASDADNQLARLDRRRASLEKELIEVLKRNR